MSAKSLGIKIDESGYEQIQKHADAAGLNMSQYLKRAIVLMMNVDDASLKDSAKIKVFDNNEEKAVIDRSILNHVK